jgi:hypothetical protein
MVCEHQRSVLFRSFSSCDDARDLVLVAHSADIIRIVVFGAVFGGTYVLGFGLTDTLRRWDS